MDKQTAIFALKEETKIMLEYKRYIKNEKNENKNKRNQAFKYI